MSRNEVSGGATGQLAPVLLPKLSDVERSTRERIETQHASLTSAVHAGRTAAELAGAFGNLGMVLMAAEFFEAAAPCFQNAASLAPRDARWTYYLAHAHRRQGDTAKAARLFEQVLVLSPGQAASSWWLGSMYLDLDRPADADVQFASIQAVGGFDVPMLYGRGRAALAQEQYAAAAAYFERLLALNTGADIVRYPLGLAYRGLGRTTEAEAQMRRRGGSEIRPPDPLLEALGQLVDSALSRHALGVDAALVGNWTAAVAHFRRVIALDPDHVSAHVNLAVALHRVGDFEGALAEATRALEISPTEARAQYVRGAILADRGRDAEAILVYKEAIRVNPDFVDAHLNLALLLQRNGRQQEALARYVAALALQPALAEAQFGSANALARLGRFREARDRFSEGMAAHPDDARFAHALARVLASAPDDAVRDGRRALALIEGLLAKSATVDRATTMALTLAELGRYDEAAGWQREALAGAARAGETGRAVLGMERNLLAFQQRRPVRQAWAEDEQPR